MLEYISAPEAAKKWGISERRVQKLCEENRIPGIAKFSRMWLIPKDAEKPMDKRKKRKGGADNESMSLSFCFHVLSQSPSCSCFFNVSLPFHPERLNRFFVFYSRRMEIGIKGIFYQFGIIFLVCKKNLPKSNQAFDLRRLVRGLPNSLFTIRDNRDIYSHNARLSS